MWEFEKKLAILLYKQPNNNKDIMIKIDNGI